MTSHQSIPWTERETVAGKRRSWFPEELNTDSLVLEIDTVRELVQPVEYEEVWLSRPLRAVVGFCFNQAGSALREGKNDRARIWLDRASKYHHMRYRRVER